MKETPRMTAIFSFGVALVSRVSRLFWNDSEYLYLEREGRRGRCTQYITLYMSPTNTAQVPGAPLRPSDEVYIQGQRFLQLASPRAKGTVSLPPGDVISWGAKLCGQHRRRQTAGYSLQASPCRASPWEERALLLSTGHGVVALEHGSGLSMGTEREAIERGAQECLPRMAESWIRSLRPRDKNLVPEKYPLISMPERSHTPYILPWRPIPPIPSPGPGCLWIAPG